MMKAFDEFRDGYKEGFHQGMLEGGIATLGQVLQYAKIKKDDDLYEWVSRNLDELEKAKETGLWIAR